MLIVTAHLGSIVRTVGLQSGRHAPAITFIQRIVPRHAVCGAVATVLHVIANPTTVTEGERNRQVNLVVAIFIFVMGCIE